MRYQLYLLLGVLGFSSCATRPVNDLKPSVSVQEAYKMTKKKNVLLFDVREKDEVQEQAFIVPHTINIPLGEIENRLAEIPKNKVLILACRSGKRSQRAYDILRANGFKNMTNMEGGMQAWEANEHIQKSVPHLD